MLGWMRAALVAALVILSTCGPAMAASPVAGIKQEKVTGNLWAALAIDWTPDGRMLVVEKPGYLKVANPDGTSTGILSVADRTNEAADRGLTGIAVDAGYASNHFVYLYYTYDAFNPDSTKPKTSRLTRIVLNDDSTVANARLAPETVILGSWPTTPANEACPAAPTNLQDCIPADGLSHVNGTVRAAADGTLFVGNGDARFAAASPPDAFRGYDARSLAGKILHVDRNGRGLPGHGFCPADADLTHNCTKVYAAGFRNPFRFDFASRGGLWAGDVGEYTWEELDHVQRGKSYGWPCAEGAFPNPAFQNDATCAARRSGNLDLPPLFAYRHGADGAAIISGPEIRSDRYPASWQGDVLVGDFVLGTLDRVKLDAAGGVLEVNRVANDWYGTDLRMGPDGYLYSVEWTQVNRLVPEHANRPPTATASVTPYAGLAPLEARFDASASSDPDGDTLTYAWSFGDGTGATGPAPVHTYATNGRYTATVTVSDAGGLSDTEELLVVVGTRPPQPEITAPAAGARFRAGTPVTLTGTATDPEDGALPDSALAWRVVLQHNQHQHQIGSFSGRSAEFTPLTSHDADSHYLVELTATDADGVAATTTHRLDPQTVRLELAVEPAVAAELVYDSVSRSAPFVHQAAVGFRTTVAAPPTLTTAEGQTLTFNGWSDGGAATHEITVPDADVRLVARYSADVTPPETYLTEGPETLSEDNTPTFRFHASERVKRFQCQHSGQGWFDCNSPYTAPRQGLRKHVFEVRAWDLAGNVDPTPATYEYYVVVR